MSASVSEAITGASPLASGLDAAIAQLTAGETYTFVRYAKYTLTSDGFVFWIATPDSITLNGAFHYSTSMNVEEDATISYNDIIFTSMQVITEFNTQSVDSIWVSTYNKMRYAFSAREPYFENANLFHYTGKAVFSTLANIVANNVPDVAQVVSNSLPAWLTLADYTPFYLTGTNPQIPLYPSFLSPSNIAPPYGIVHIEPTRTTYIQAIPWMSKTGDVKQLAQDHISITLYGIENNLAMDFLNLIYQYSMNTDNFGIMTPGTIRDGKKPQNEIQAIAMQKLIEFDVSYNQIRMQTIARQLILKATLIITLA